MKSFRYLKNDVLQCALKIVSVGLCIAIIVLLFAHDLTGFFQEMRNYGGSVGDGNFFDYIAYFFSGEYEYEISVASEFNLPVDWLAYNALIAYLVGFYPYEDMISSGKLGIIYSGKRIYWLLGKVLLQISLVLWCYFVTYFVMLLYIAFRNLSFDFLATYDIWSRLIEIQDNFTLSNSILLIVIMPIAASIVMSIIQLYLELRFSPVIAFFSIVLMLVLSVYKKSYLLLGNYTMWYRSALGQANGLEAKYQLVILIGVFFTVLCLCLRYFKKADIIGKQCDI